MRTLHIIKNITKTNPGDVALVLEGDHGDHFTANKTVAKSFDLKKTYKTISESFVFNSAIYNQVNVQCQIRTIDKAPVLLRLTCAGRLLIEKKFSANTNWATYRTNAYTDVRVNETINIELISAGRFYLKEAKIHALFVPTKESIPALAKKVDTHNIHTDCHKIRQLLQLVPSFPVQPPIKVKPRVSILTPTFNGLDLIKSCHIHLSKNTDKSLYEWLVLDDASTDGTTEWLKQNTTAKVTAGIVRNFSKANNLLAEKAEGEFLVFLNNDCYVQENWLTNFLSLMDEDPTIGAAGGLLLFPGQKTVQHCGVVFIPYDERGPLPGHLFHGEPIDLHHQKPKEFQAVTAACMIVRKDLFEKVGRFNEDYIFGYEDIDLCLKIKHLGYKIVYSPTSSAIHEQGATLETKPEKHQLFLHNKTIFNATWSHIPAPDCAQYTNDKTFNDYCLDELTATVLYVPVTRGTGPDIYRVDNMVEGLKKNNVDVQTFNWQDPQWPDKADIIIMQRFLPDINSRPIYHELRRRFPEAKFVYEIDDYIFDRPAAIQAKVAEDIVASTSKYNNFMKEFDWFFCSTPYLKDRIEELFHKPCFVIGNAVSDSFAAQKQKNDFIVIGYASGTPTHDHDFAIALPAIESILIQNPFVELTLLGPVSVPLQILQRFGTRIKRFPFVPFYQFPTRLATIDINLAPLVMNDFNQAKSALKYIEAGKLGIPTVASATRTYREAITNGLNGFVCRTMTDWIDSLQQLIRNTALRDKIGAQARTDVLQKHSTPAIGAYLKKVLRGIQGG